MEDAAEADREKPSRKELNIRQIQSLLFSPIQTSDSERVRGEACLAESCGEHSLLHLFWLWEARDAGGEIRVGPGNSAEHGTDLRQHVAEIESIESSDQT